MKTVAIIQARTSSQRLPQKVLADICGKPMLHYVIERVRAAVEIDQVIIATSIETDDDPVAALTEKLKATCFRGSLNDVLSRYYHAAAMAKADIVVRITADCPLIDPGVVDRMVTRYKAGSLDYIVARANDTPGGYPRGTNVEVFSFAQLKALHKTARDKNQREHVTQYFDDNPEQFNSLRVDAEPGLARPSYRITVDTPDDLELVRKIVTHFRGNTLTPLADVINYLDSNPELTIINNGPTIVFRVDADVAIGTGNFARCRQLAAALKLLGYTPVFLISDSRVARKLVKSAGFTSILLQSRDHGFINELRLHLKRLSPAALIMDLVACSFEQLSLLRRYSGLLVNLAPELETANAADIEVDGDIEPKKRPCHESVNYLLGPDYKITSVTSPAPDSIQTNEQFKRILLYMGGTDPLGLTGHLIRILASRTDLDIEIFIGAANPDRKALKEQLGSYPHMRPGKDGNKFTTALAKADLAIIGGGLTLYEAAQLGTPAMVVAQNLTQQNDAKMFQNRGACLFLGLGKPPEKKIQKVLSTIASPDLRAEIARKALRLCKRNGAQQVARHLHKRMVRTASKSLLVIGGGQEQVPLVEAGKSLGLRVVCIDGNTKAPARLCADAFYPVNTTDIKRILTLAKRHDAAAAITSTESGVIPAAIVSKALKLKGHPPGVAAQYPDKAAMKQCFIQKGIATAPYCSASTYDQALGFVRSHGHPCVVKPRDNAGARGVQIVYTDEQLHKAWKEAQRFTQCSDLLIEKFVQGPEFGCESFRYNGQFHVVLTEKKKSKAPYRVVMGHYTIDQHTELKNFVCQTLERLNLEGPVNMDIILSDQGPVLLECGLRLGGNLLPELVYLSSGINPYKQAIRYALDRPADLSPRWNRAAAIEYFSPPPGMVTGYSGFTENTISSNVVDLVRTIKPGEKVEAVEHVQQRIGHVIVEGNNRKNVLKHLEEFKRTNRILTR